MFLKGKTTLTLPFEPLSQSVAICTILAVSWMSGINKASPSFSSSSSLLVVKPLPAVVPPLLELVIVVVVGAAVVAVVPLFAVPLLPLFLLDLQMSQ